MAPTRAEFVPVAALIATGTGVDYSLRSVSGPRDPPARRQRDATRFHLAPMRALIWLIRASCAAQ